MNNLNWITWVFAGLILYPCLAPSQTITQEEFLNHLTKHHPLFEKEKLTSQIQKEEQNSYLGTEDWNVVTSLNYSHEEPLIAIAGPEKIDAITASGGIERIFWKTGGRFSASVTSSRADIKLDPLFNFPSSFYQNQVSLSYSHPLMRNRKGFLDRLQYQLKQFDIDFSEIQAKENMEDFLKAAGGKFLDWVFLSEQRKISVDRLRLSEEELDRIKRKREVNLVDQADVIRAEDVVRTWNQNLVLIESQWNALQAELSELSRNSDLINAGPAFNLYGLVPRIPMEDAIAQLKDQSRILKVLNIRLQQLEYVEKGITETAKADLSLITQFNIKKLDEGLAKSLGLEKPDALIGLQYTFPVKNRTAKHQLEKTYLQITQLKTQREEISIALTSALTNVCIQIRELENVLNLNLKQIESAKERTKEELNLYNQGRGDLTFVILSRDNEENAKLTYAVNALTYHKLNLEYNALMDQIYP